MIKLGAKRGSKLRVGDWVYTKERFIDGFELVPFVDETGAVLESRAFQTQFYPELWRAADTVLNPVADIDKTTGTIFYPSNLSKNNCAQIFLNGSTSFVGKNGTDFYLYSAIEGLSDHKTGVGNYTYSGLPKGYKTSLLVLDGNEKIKTSTDSGATWTDFINLGRNITCFDVGRHCTEILIVSSIFGSGGVYTQHVCIADESTGSLITTELPTTELSTSQIVNCWEFQHFDSEYNADNQYVVRHMASQPTDPVFSFFNKKTNKWVPAVAPLQYGAYNSGSDPVLSSDASKIYWAYEQSLYVFDFVTGKFLKRIQIASKTNNPPTSQGSQVYNNDNFSYNCNGIELLRMPYMENPDKNGSPEFYDVIVIAGGEHAYFYVDDGKNIVNVLYSSIVSDAPKPAFLAAKDGNVIRLVLKNGLIKCFNQLPFSTFAIKAIKENGVVNTGYSLVVRKLP